MSNTIGFDESFYLSQNPDVAAAVSRGIFTSGAQHFQLNGRFEGRNPNAFFNTSFYLGQYPDVAKAGINPLTHFLTSGAAEGRFANATEKGAIDLNGNGGADDFNNAKYLADYPDVATAVTNGTFKSAYQHFVQFGQFEGRVATLADGSTITGPFSNTGANPNAGGNFAFTVNTDTLVGTSANDTFTAGVTGGANGGATLTAGDSVNGGTGTDTLNIFGNDNAAAFTGANVKSVEIVNAQLAAGSLNVSGNADVRTASLVDGSTGSSTLTLTKAQTAGIQGKVGTGNTDVTTIAFSDATAGTADAASVSVNAASTTALKINAIETLTINATGKNALGNLSADSVSKLVVTGNGSVSLVAVDTDAGTAGYQGGTYKTIDASANTGGVTLDISAVTAQDVAITGGSGNDTVTLTQAGLTKLDVINLGAGTNTLSFTDGLTISSASDADKLAGVTNVQVLKAVGSTLTIDNDFVSQRSFAVSGNGAATAITNATQGTTVEFGAGDFAASTLGMKLGSNTVNINLAGSATAASLVDGATNTPADGLTFTGTSSININSTGTVGVSANVIELTAADNQAIVITGSQALNLTAKAATGTTGFSIDGSAATGALSITGTTAADILKGGSGADTLISNGGSDTLTGGAGLDKFNVKASVNTGQTVDATITDMVKGETVQLSDGNTANAATQTFTKADVTGASTLQAAVTTAAAGDGGTTSLVKWFQFSGDTYIVQDNKDGAYDATTDQVVKLTGIHDLSTATYDSASHILTHG